MSKRASASESPKGDGQNSTTTLPSYTLEQLNLFTENFDDSKRKGSGSSAIVYQGIDDGKPIALKRYRAGAEHLPAQYSVEKAFYSSYQHPNIIKAFGVCEENDKEPCFILEYAPKVLDNEHKSNLLTNLFLFK
ncbi:LEAF RUST 10 DISEASE-RESISTANCE LOCUS RECEPTOR-LIKE PROTEIN KINASE-like 1.2 [Mercurialis annua]|uniref:LEAF RUST 10 DISEASE-RESISTANCE LOCUS RECEPTOR-LIKE PROTEIN KINASE-like 1.2 n=1 Tax=Mercurialis annua TaxID=3986 RepID=UPI002160DB70|nr:LEAF RUST 10 DISEASE-RESISTANCE LOCUS RECEPTOR-LIKE PROTEIN KINASE-like 1.2 [Mercurialis annua]XP_050208469.1 LEAF RUST 10 DISEASE-RESISTANCE LOCUS RECEPTOR-LIKE PROTEIN KINASE-like 1.2 [Mercurialis annua]